MAGDVAALGDVLLDFRETVGDGVEILLARLGCLEGLGLEGAGALLERVLGHIGVVRPELGHDVTAYFDALVARHAVTPVGLLRRLLVVRRRHGVGRRHGGGG